jgi:hypothetical protein
MWNDIGAKEMQIGGFRGLYENVSPTERPLGALSSMSNLVLDMSHALTTRPGVTLLGSTTPPSTSAVFGIHSFYHSQNSTSNALLAHIGSDIYAYDSTASAFSTTPLSTDMHSVASASATLNDICCIFDGSTHPKKYSSTGIAALSSSVPPARYAVAAYEQLFVCGMSTRAGDVDACDTADPETWEPASTNNAVSITITKEGDKAKWIDKAFGLVTVWGQYGVYAISGPEVGDAPALWSVKMKTRRGTPNGRTVREVGNAWVWLNDSGFAVWAGGDAEIVIDPIKTSFSLIDWSEIDSAESWVDKDGRYWCQVIDTDGDPLYFCYDPKGGWSAGTGTQYTASGSYRFDGEETPLVGDGDGFVYKVEGDDDNGTAISWNAVVGPSALGSVSAKKELIRVHGLISAGSSATTIRAFVSNRDTGPYGSGQSLTPSTLITQYEFYAPVSGGEWNRGAILRMRLAGSGKVNIHDASLVVREAGR